MNAQKDWISRHAQKSLERLLPRVRSAMGPRDEKDKLLWQKFEKRTRANWEGLFRLLFQLYGWQYDFFYHLEQIMITAACSWAGRPEYLRELDDRREADPQWFQSQEMVGGVLYVDLFSRDLTGLYDHIEYFRKLGLTYLHLMPVFAVPHGNSDGGYAVSDYRSINPDIGTMQELSYLARTLHDEGISLVLDLVMNHTSDDHQWARRAKAGDPDYQEYYLMFEDRTMPDQYQHRLRDIFPDTRRGCFTYSPECGKWVWTTFNSFQWDLNYANPAVFRAMAEEMLFLANRGVQVLRLDAVAFIWKRLGTDCENLPEAHMLVQAFNALARIAAPCLLFKSEAIVHPDEVLNYISPNECQLSYNPMLMALLWEALATREVKLLNHAMKKRTRIHPECAWVNYLRCHDDIGWSFDDNDAWEMGINPQDHRGFLNRFYTGVFPGSFAKGLPFQFNPETGDMRISGTLASLAGLEYGLEKNDAGLIEEAVRRINLLRSIMLSAGGIPLIYLGDEWGMLNDYTYLSDPAKAADSRWVHRARRRWAAGEDIGDSEVLEWRFFNELVRLVMLRKALAALRNGNMEVVDTGNPHVFGFIREYEDQKLLIVNNFSDNPQSIAQRRLNQVTDAAHFSDRVAGCSIVNGNGLVLEGYRFAWLECKNS
ncbi:MAG: alpha-glucosidase C-terminal domain-containing protein [Desulfobacteraceae bacterium]|nr:alpha-glucosidase C-terminal domain-containing protein [Desulfobacteraceae bacterium]